MLKSKETLLSVHEPYVNFSLNMEEYY